MRKEAAEGILADSDISIQHLSIEHEGHYLAAVDNKGSCYMLALKAGSGGKAAAFQRRLKFTAHKRYALKCRFSPDSTLLVTTSADQTAKVWRTADLLPLVETDGTTEALSWPCSENLSPFVALKDSSQRWVWDVAFSNDSQYCITGNYLDSFISVMINSNKYYVWLEKFHIAILDCLIDRRLVRQRRTSMEHKHRRHKARI